MKKGRKYAKRKKTTPRVESKKLSDSEIFCRNLKKRLNGTNEDEKFLESFLNSDF